MLSEYSVSESDQGLSTGGVRLSADHSSDPEVVPVAKRRRYSTDYKLRILEEADQCQEFGQMGYSEYRYNSYTNDKMVYAEWKAPGDDSIYSIPLNIEIPDDGESYHYTVMVDVSNNSIALPH